jgi:hypothetical protein
MDKRQGCRQPFRCIYLGVSMKHMPRRELLRRGLTLIPLFSVAPLVVSRADEAKSCVDHASESLRSSLHYKIVSTEPDKDCSRCGFFTVNGTPSCGECAIMSGPVDATGWCESWSPNG